MIFGLVSSIKESISKEPISLTMSDKSTKGIIDLYNQMGLSADAFIEKTGLCDKALLSYFGTVESGSATLKGCKTHIESVNNSIGMMGIKSKATTVIINGFKAALNGLITGAIITLVSKFVQSLIDAIPTAEKIRKEAEKAKETIDDITNSLKEQENTVEEIKQRYAELAQGVDQFSGKNLTLSNDDYEEFLDLSNQLAELFPTLPRIYRENGKAIVQLSGDVDTIVGSLNNLIKAQRDLANRQIVNKLPAIFDGVTEKSDRYEQQLSDLESRRDALVKSLGDVQSEEFSSNFMDSFSNKWIEISSDNLEVISQIRDDYIKILKEANIDFEELTPTYDIKEGVEVPVGFTIKINSSDEDVEKAKNTIDGKIQELASQYVTDIKNLNDEIDITNKKNKANWTSLSSSIFAWLSTDDSFKIMDDTMQIVVQNIINDLDWTSLDFSSWEEATQYIQDNILSLFSTADSNIKSQLTKLFTEDLTPNEKVSIAQQIQDYINELNKDDALDNDIDFSLDFILDGENENSVQNLINRVNNSVAGITGDDARSAHELKKYIANNVTTEDQMNKWLEVTKNITNAGEAIRKYEESLTQPKDPYIDFFTEDNLKNVDEYKDKISDLNKYLQTINENNKLSADDMATLNTKYGIFATSIEEYEQKIIDRMNKIASSDDVMMALAEAIETCNDAAEKERLQSLYDTLSKLNIEAQKNADAFGNFETAISSLQSKAELLRDLNETIRDVGYIDSSKLDDIISAYPELTEKVAEFNAKLITSSELFDEIQKAYEKDATKYKISVMYKLQYNNEFYSKVKEDLPNWVKEQARAYGINLDNYKTFNETKLALDKEYFRKKQVLELMAQKLNIKLSADGIYEPGVDTTKGVGKVMYSRYLENMQELEDYEKFIEEFDITLANIFKDIDTLWKSFGKDKSDLTEMDWAEQSLSILQNKVDELQTELDNTEGVENQKNAIEDLNSALEDLKDGYGAAYETYADKYEDTLSKLGKNSSSIKFKIESGEEFDFSKYDSETASIIQEAISYHNKLLEIKASIDNCTKSQLENNKAILLLPVQQYEDLVEDLENTLKTQTKIKEEIEGAINAASDLIQTQIDDYENLREASNNSYDNQIKDIQAKKDALTESNNLLENQIALEKAQYELHRAKTQKNIKVLRNGEFVYEADQDAIREAQEELDKALYNQKISDFDNQIKSLEDAKEEADNEYEKQIKRLTDYKDKIDSIFESYEQVLGLQKLTEQFGADIIQRIISGDASAIAEMNTTYINISTDVNETEEKIERYQQDIEAIKTLAEEWDGSANTIESAKKKIDTIISDNKKEIKAIKKRNSNTKSLAIEWSNTELSIQETLDLINEDHLLSTETEADILSQRLESIKDFAKKAKSYLDSINSNLATAKEKQAELNRIEDENKKKTTSSKTTTSNKYSKTVNVGKSHDGMELGYIGDANSKESKDTFKLIALSELKQDEIPRILQVGEAVLTKWQQQNILDNIHTSFNSGLQFGNLLNKKQDIPSISFNGDIILQGVQNTTEFAQKIKLEFLNKLNQELYKK